MAAISGIDITGPAPNVNFAQMGHHIGKRVTLVGRVEGVQGNSIQVKAADEGTVTVMLRGPAPQEAYVSVVGTVESPNTLREEGHSSFGNTFGERGAGVCGSVPRLASRCCWG